MTNDGSESVWEDLALERLDEHGWEMASGTSIAPGTERGREKWSEIHLPERILEAMARLNPSVPAVYLTQARDEILAPTSQDAITENQRVHQILTQGYRGLVYLDADGVEHNPTIRLVGHRPEDNDFLAVNQVIVRDREHDRRFDVVLYLNGLPVVIIELKKAGSAHADVEAAYAQLATYLREFPMAFRCCVVTVISDGLTARYGTPFTPLEHYAPWNVDDDGRPVELTTDFSDTSVGVELEVLIDGLFNHERFLQLQRSFVAFDGGESGFAKRVAKPHQYFAVTKAVGTTVDAVATNGKAGVVWHTHGSGKSMEMELYTHLVLTHERLRNPTVIVITDRKELDGQLFDGFNRSLLLPEKPVRITTRAQLRTELTERATGGIYFTTLQKFGKSRLEKESGWDHPLLSDRRNLVVIVDEAHRSHYDDLDGYARHLKDALPYATMIAFTGTPVSFDDRDTREVFGDYIDTYDLSRAVDDGATVPVIFEPRLIRMSLGGDVTEDDLDQVADEATEGLDDTERAQIEKSVAVINAVYGAPARLRALAEDIVTHWDARSTEIVKFIDGPGKAMIVGATREICARLYDEIVALQPQWHSDAIDRGVVKVIYSGSASDPEHIARHVRRESQNKTIKARLKDADDELQLVIVKDMMLTGYDSPPLHTLYLDRPLKGALLMQTLARVNRTFRGKPSGLLVGYAPVAENLNAALAEYSANDRARRSVGRDIDEAAALTRQLIETIDALCAPYDWRRKLDDKPRSWLKAAVGLTNWLRNPATPGNQLADGEQTVGQRYRQLTNQLSRAWVLCAGNETLAELRPAARFYEEVRVYMAKYDAAERQARGEPIPAEIQRLLSDLVAESTESGEIVDIYEAAGIAKPRLDDLTDTVARQAREATNAHLAIEALRDLLTEEAGQAARHNVVRQRAFSERINELMNRYTNQQLTSAEVIAQLIELAREVAAEGNRGARFEPPLSTDELAFYDAVADNESAVELQGEAVLAQIARELVEVMRRDVKSDWTVRDDVRAKLRSSVKRLLVKYKYPPDKQPEAIKLVIEQMESMAMRVSG
ncbi:MAG: type I restriction endonuclease subunit R [Nocardioidaceae bacterium]